jgi:predicted nucleic acid-binding protein
VLIAIDTNVLIDQADGNEDVLDAIAIIRTRVHKAQFIVTRTVLEELAFGARETNLKGEMCRTALRSLGKWGYQGMDVVPVGRGIVEQIGRALRSGGVLPDEEENDASIIAEAALLGCGMLLTSDTHLVEAQENPALKTVLEAADVSVPVIGRPRFIARKFARAEN